MCVAADESWARGGGRGTVKKIRENFPHILYKEIRKEQVKSNI